MSTAPITPTIRAVLSRSIGLLLTAVALFALSAPQQANAALVADKWVDRAPTSMPGWKADFVDNFQGPLKTSVWGRYQGGQAIGGHSTYQSANLWVDNDVQVGDGVLKLTTKKVNGSWTSGGMSSARGFSATRGKWVFKAKFDRAYGVGYAFLLMPKGGGWPPELDIIEGTMGGPHIMSTFHYGTTSNHLQVQRWIKGVNMKVWHTYGVVMSSNRISYTIDGREWASVTTSAVPTMPMWFGMQAAVKNCAKSTGECLSSATPTSANIHVDWVAHYRKV